MRAHVLGLGGIARVVTSCVTCITIAFLCAGFPGAEETRTEQATAQNVAEMTEWVFDGVLELPEVPEPSGLCYCPARDSLFVVDDGAEDRAASIAELDLHGKVLQQQFLGRDLEGVCYCTADGLLYVSDEYAEQVYAVDPATLKLVRGFSIARTFNGAPLLEDGGNGIEGIGFIPGDSEADSYFLLLNQEDPRCLVRIPYLAAHAADGGAEIALESWLPLPDINAGELHYDAEAKELWVIHSWMNLLEVLDVPTLALKRWEVVPGCAQEAVALDGQGRLWIGSDTGGLARYTKTGSKPGTGV